MCLMTPEEVVIDPPQMLKKDQYITINDGTGITFSTLGTYRCLKDFFPVSTKEEWFQHVVETCRDLDDESTNDAFVTWLLDKEYIEDINPTDWDLNP